jgi:hypothetical protein
MEKTSPTIIYILSLPPATSPNRIMTAKERNKNQLPPENFPSPSVPNNNGCQ